jgi:general stress protein YciG
VSPAKVMEYGPTAVKREMTKKTTEGGETATNPEEAKEIARKSGMAKGTANADKSWDL